MAGVPGLSICGWSGIGPRQQDTPSVPHMLMCSSQHPPPDTACSSSTTPTAHALWKRRWAWRGTRSYMLEVGSTRTAMQEGSGCASGPKQSWTAIGSASVTSPGASGTSTQLFVLQLLQLQMQHTNPHRPHLHGCGTGQDQLPLAHCPHHSRAGG